MLGSIPDLTTLARIAVAGPTEFVQLVQEWAVRHGHPPDEVLTAIINEWIERVSSTRLAIRYPTMLTHAWGCRLTTCRRAGSAS